MNLNQITIPTKDIPKSIEFYTKLGLQLIVHTSNDYARFVCPDGNSTFSLQKTNEAITETEIRIYFEVDDLDEKIDQLIATGIHIDQMPEDKPWLWRESYLKDPDGNQIILYFAGKNRINPPWRINK